MKRTAILRRTPLRSKRPPPRPAKQVEYTPRPRAAAVAVVDAQGGLIARAGEPHLLSFTRSTLKPLQALPFMEGGGAGGLPPWRVQRHRAGGG